VRHVVFSPDGRRLYSSRMQGTFLGVSFQQPSELLIWNADSVEQPQAQGSGKSGVR
jgi:hypothetical protein